MINNIIFLYIQIIEEMLKPTNFDKNEKVEFKLIKSQTKRETSRFKYFRKLISKLNKAEKVDKPLTPFQKFRSVARGIFHLLHLYRSVQKFKRKLKNFKVKGINVMIRFASYFRKYSCEMKKL